MLVLLRSNVAKGGRRRKKKWNGQQVAEMTWACGFWGGSRCGFPWTCSQRHHSHLQRLRALGSWTSFLGGQGGGLPTGCGQGSKRKLQFHLSACGLWRVAPVTQLVPTLCASDGTEVCTFIVSYDREVRDPLSSYRQTDKSLKFAKCSRQYLA